MARPVSFAVLIAIILGTVLLVGAAAIVSVWPDGATDASQTDANTVGFAATSGNACPLEASQYVTQTFTYQVLGNPYTVKVAIESLKAILTVNGESTPQLGVGESATLTTGTVVRVKSVTHGLWGNRVMFCLTPTTAETPPPVPIPPTPTPNDVITCPIDGTVFAPVNPEFLGLVGNELQIAVYYNASLAHLAQKYAEAGVKQVRIAIDWRSIEPTKGTYSWGYTDMRIGAFPPEGIAPVGIIDATPQWASSCPTSNHSAQCTPADINEYKKFVRAVVRRYGPTGTNTVHDWEIRTENGNANSPLTKEQYIAELNAAYEVIKQEDPTARVWGPEVVFHRGNFAYPDGVAYQWVRYAIQNGQYDVFSIHQFHNLTSAYEHTKRVRQMLDAAGQQDIPLAVSAMGSDDYLGARTQESQAHALKDLYACVSAAGADSAMWFSGTEWPDFNDPNKFGIFDYDFTIPARVKPKLAYYALKTLGASIEAPDEPPVPPTPTPSNLRHMPVACTPGSDPALVSQEFLGMGMKEAGPWLNTLTNTTYLEWMAQELDDAGVRSTITGVGWPSSEAQNNTFTWINDPVIANLTLVGIKPIAALSGTPTWASSNPTSDKPGAYPPRSMDDWKDAVREAVRHYGPAGKNQVHDWKIWNEPNGLEYWRGSREEFTALLNAGYDTIKQEDPTAKVWAPGIVYHENNRNSTGPNSPDAWVDHIIANGRFDVLTIHMYYYDPVDMRDTVRQVRQKLDAAGKQNVALAVTEFNVFDFNAGTCPYWNLTETQQAENLRRSYACIAEGGAASAYWFTATDRPNNNPAINCPGGWIRSGVFTRTPPTEKLSYSALRDIGVALGTASTATPPPPARTATLNATPCIIASEKKTCSTMISWISKGVVKPYVQIFVGKTMFACGPSNVARSKVAIVSSGELSEFVLYSATSCTEWQGTGAPLAKIVVQPAAISTSDAKTAYDTTTEPQAQNRKGFIASKLASSE